MNRCQKANPIAIQEILTDWLKSTG
jgi:hypothetical protein